MTRILALLLALAAVLCAPPLARGDESEAPIRAVVAVDAADIALTGHFKLRF